MPCSSRTHFCLILTAIVGVAFVAPGPVAAQDVGDEALPEGATAPSLTPTDPWYLLRPVRPGSNGAFGDQNSDFATDGLAQSMRSSVTPTLILDASGQPIGPGQGRIRGQNDPDGIAAVQNPQTVPQQTGALPANVPSGDPLAGEAVAQRTEYRATGFDRQLDTVAERRREELDPLGLRAGSFTVLPQVNAEGSVTDNVFYTSQDRKTDTKVTLRPSVLIRSDWSRHALNITGEGEWGSFSQYTSENVLRGSLTGEARADLTPFLSAGLRLSASSDQEGRGSSDAVAGATRPTRLMTYDGEASIAQRFNRLVATLRGGLSQTDYDDVDLRTGGSDNNDDRDVGEVRGGLRLSYELSPATSVYADGSYDRRTYRNRLDDDGFERSSTGWRGVIGASAEIGHVARADAAVGYVTREYDDVRLDGIGEITADGRLFWAVTPLTTLRLRAATEVAETTTAGASARVTRMIAAGLDHELLRHFVISADGGYENETKRGAGEETDTITASIAGEYRFTREASLVARYTYETEHPNDDSGTTSENIVSLGLTIRR